MALRLPLSEVAALAEARALLCRSQRLAPVLALAFRLRLPLLAMGEIGFPQGAAPIGKPDPI